MTKSLTKQWREGKLPKGWYYCLCNDEIKKLYCEDGESLELDDPETGAYYFFHRKHEKGQVEVLAPVPEYHTWKNVREQWKVAIPQIEKQNKKIEKLEQQLAEANKALKQLTCFEIVTEETMAEYKDPDDWETTNVAQEYLDKWGVK